MNHKDVLKIANSLSNEDILTLIPMIGERMTFWDNEGGKEFKLLMGENDRWHSLNGPNVQIELIQLKESL